MLERQTFLNKDLVLKVSPSYDPKRFDPNIYEAFLDALCGDREYQKALELQKQNQNASIVSILRDLVEKDRQEWAKGKKERRG